ncbi:MAG TPA: TetR/AcrR family transcriptional regulator [Chitinophagaceae bacterium]|nr:TetR/AcrR family transcriptional regulator [Chitinophagaceae bacterium]
MKTRSAKKDLILQEAAKLFREKGFGGTSMRDLAEKVGIEAASMYNHIRSKDEILEEICFGAGRKYDEQLSEIERQDINYPRKLELMIAFHVQMIIEDGAAVSVLNNDWKFLSAEKMTEFKTMRNAYEKHFAALLKQGMEQGFFKPMNVSIALFTILSALRWVELWYKPGRNVSKEDLAKDISALLMNGIKA